MRRLTFACSLLAATVTNAAQAGSPLFTEDAAILDAKACEVEGYLAKATQPAGHSGGVQVGCGVSYHSQVTVAIGRDSASASNLAGIIGKTTLMPLSDTNAGLAIMYAASFQKSPRADARYEAVEAKLALTIPAEQWQLHANTGWARARSEAAGAMTWNLAAERLGTVQGLDLMAEIFGDNHHDPWLRIAARWALITDRIYLFASWGRQAARDKNQLVVSGLHMAF